MSAFRRHDLDIPGRKIVRSCAGSLRKIIFAFDVLSCSTEICQGRLCLNRHGAFFESGAVKVSFEMRIVMRWGGESIRAVRAVSRVPGFQGDMSGAFNVHT